VADVRTAGEVGPRCPPTGPVAGRLDGLSLEILP
jgi:hypothetical protein